MRKWYKIPTQDSEMDGKEPNFFPITPTPIMAYCQQVDEDFFYVLLYESIPFYELSRVEVEAAGIDFDIRIDGRP